MSRYWSPEKAFRCTNDCHSSGCPGHVMRLRYECGVDHVVVEVDDDPYRYVFDDDTIATIVELYNRPEHCGRFE
jgi:hypothetical protein